MLEFLKKIFKNEEEVKQVIEIKLQNLEEWINERAKPLIEEIKQEIDKIFLSISEELQRARFNTELLENAKLQNPNIPFKAKQYMEGNRKAYIRSVNSFLGHMEINNKDYYYLLGFCKLFDELINDLNKGTLRSYAILQEFFANETNKIAQNLKNFDGLFTELKVVLYNDKMVAVNETIDKSQSLRTKVKQKINYDVDLRDMEARIKLANDEKDSIMLDIMNFSKSSEHEGFVSLNEQRKNKEKSFYGDQDKILQSFSILERPLRKYSHIAFEHEEITLDYLKDIIKTLADDKELKILEVLKNLEKMLNEGQIEIDERKKEKSLDEIKKLNKEFFQQFMKKYFSFKSEIREIEEKIIATGVAEKLKNFNIKLEDINFKIEKSNEEFNRLKSDVSKVNNLIENLKEEIQSSVKQIFNEEIRVVG